MCVCGCFGCLSFLCVGFFFFFVNDLNVESACVHTAETNQMDGCIFACDSTPANQQACLLCLLRSFKVDLHFNL